MKLLPIVLIVAKHNLRMVAICDVHHVLLLKALLKYFDVRSPILLLSHNTGNNLCMVAP